VQTVQINSIAWVKRPNVNRVSPMRRTVAVSGVTEPGAPSARWLVLMINTSWLYYVEGQRSVRVQLL